MLAVVRYCELFQWAKMILSCQCPHHWGVWKGWGGAVWSNSRGNCYENTDSYWDCFYFKLIQTVAVALLMSVNWKDAICCLFPGGRHQLLPRALQKEIPWTILQSWCFGLNNFFVCGKCTMLRSSGVLSVDACVVRGCAGDWGWPRDPRCPTEGS